MSDKLLMSFSFIQCESVPCRLASFEEAFLLFSISLLNLWCVSTIFCFFAWCSWFRPFLRQISHFCRCFLRLLLFWNRAQRWKILYLWHHAYRRVVNSSSNIIFIAFFLFFPSFLGIFWILFWFLLLGDGFGLDRWSYSCILVCTGLNFALSWKSESQSNGAMVATHLAIVNCWV